MPFSWPRLAEPGGRVPNVATDARPAAPDHRAVVRALLRAGVGFHVMRYVPQEETMRLLEIIAALAIYRDLAPGFPGWVQAQLNALPALTVADLFQPSGAELAPWLLGVVPGE